MLNQIIQGDCLEKLKDLPADSIDLVLTDPPYFEVKDEDWDNQWKDADEFINWLGSIVSELKRVLKPNGSLYLFASPELSARVECKINETFHVLNNIRWVKKDGWHQKTEREALRSYLSPWESIIFAEQYGDQYAEAEKALHKDVYAPIGRYIQLERERAGFTRSQVEVALGFVSRSDPTRGTALCYRWEEGSSLPTEDTYLKLRGFLNSKGQTEYLRKEYEELRKEYEELRRPFQLNRTLHAFDLWDYPTVKPFPGKHPCEKPQALLRYAITNSSKPGDIVLDCFLGSGATAEAALATGRKFIGIEKSPHWVSYAKSRVNRELQLDLWEKEMVG
jgi:adenine-specific DNA-methyltransferase